jgi:hypothetical protein
MEGEEGRRNAVAAELGLVAAGRYQRRGRWLGLVFRDDGLRPRDDACNIGIFALLSGRAILFFGLALSTLRDLLLLTCLEVGLALAFGLRRSSG